MPFTTDVMPTTSWWLCVRRTGNGLGVTLQVRLDVGSAGRGCRRQLGTVPEHGPLRCGRSGSRFRASGWPGTARMGSVACSPTAAGAVDMSSQRYRSLTNTHPTASRRAHPVLAARKIVLPSPLDRTHRSGDHDRRRRCHKGGPGTLGIWGRAVGVKSTVLRLRATGPSRRACGGGSEELGLRRGDAVCHWPGTVSARARARSPAVRLEDA